MQRIGSADFNIDELRERLCKMTDDELRKFGRAASKMVKPKANLREPPREEFVIQLEEARAEWRRRHPKT